MMNNNIELLKKIRNITGISVINAKKELIKANFNIDIAIKNIFSKNNNNFNKKKNINSYGKVKILIKNNIAIIIEMIAETDFVVRNYKFNELMDFILLNILEKKPKTLIEFLNFKKENERIKDKILKVSNIFGEKIILNRFKILFKKDNEKFDYYIHSNNKIGVLINFVCKNNNNNNIKKISKDICMQIAAMNPYYINEYQIPKKIFEKKIIDLKQQLIKEKKKKEIINKIIIGRLNKFKSNIVLEKQIFIKDSSKKIEQILNFYNLKINKFIRFENGEEIYINNRENKI